MALLARSATGAKLHDAFADGDYTANPAWTKSGTANVSGGEIQLGATGPIAAYISAAPSSLGNSDYVTARAKLGSSTNATNNWLDIIVGTNTLSDYYHFRVLHNSGTSEGNKSVASVVTAITTFNSGITDTAYHDFAVKWTSGVLTLYIDGVLKATMTDSSHTSFSPPLAFFRNSPGSGTHGIFDDICVMDSWSVTCSGLPTGWKLRVISDSGGTEVATATESSGTATVDLTGKTGPFPYYGALVLDASNAVHARLVPSATVSGHTIAGVFGGDAFAFTPSAAGEAWAWADSPTLSTDLQKYESGEFVHFSGSSVAAGGEGPAIIQGGGTATVSVTSGVVKLESAETGASYDHGVLIGASSSNNGQTNVTVDDNVAVSADVGAYSANSAHAADILLYQDASNWYRLEVAKTAGGTSTLYKKSGGGAETTIATVAKGVALNAMARVQVVRDSSGTFTIVVDGVTQSDTDVSPLSGPFTIRFGAPASAGTSDCRVDNVNVQYGGTIRILGLSGTQSAALYNAAGTLIDTATQTGGIAYLDASGVALPLTGYVRLFTDNTYATPLPRGHFPTLTATTEFYGGDDLYYQLTGMQVLSANAEGTYPTTQTGSHNGVITDGTVTTWLVMADRNEVELGQYDSATGLTRTLVVGTHNDMHSSCDIQRDSTGVYHLIWGGSSYGTVRYRKSVSTDPFDLGTEENLGEYIRGSLLIDQADVLYLVGATGAQDKIVCKKRSSGTWQATQTIVQADTAGGWSVYSCDAAIGKEASGQKSVHQTFMAWSAATGFEHAFYVWTADAGANWRGLEAGNFTLPLTQTTATGLLSNAKALIVSGDYGVSRLSVDATTFSYQVNVIVSQSTTGYVYFRGTPGSAWPASPTFSGFTGGVSGSNHGAIERFGNYLVYMSCLPGSASLILWLSIDNGDTWTATTMLTRPTGARGIWYWPKLTPIIGSGYARVVWGTRGTVYGNKNGSSPLSGVGVGSLMAADVVITLTATSGESWTWSESPSSTQTAPNRTASEQWDWSENVTRDLTSTPSIDRGTTETWTWADGLTVTLTLAPRVGLAALAVWDRGDGPILVGV